MPPKFQIPQEDSFDKKVEIYQEKQRLSMVSGYIMMAALQAIVLGDTEKLKIILMQFGYENVEELQKLSFDGLAPFKGLKPHNILRFPDEVREQSLINESTDKLDGECPCEVSLYNGEVYVRWTLPRIEYILKCKSPRKLAHLGMVIIEELLHIRQIISPNTRAINTLSTMYEFGAVKGTSQMDEEDQQLLAGVLETDITLFYDKYFGNYADLQWFTDRHNADDYHRTLTPQQFVDAIMYLNNKYGYIEEVCDNILDDIFSAIDFNPYIGFPMLLAPSLYKYVGEDKILRKLMEILSEYPQIVENPELAPIVAQILKTLVSNSKEN